MQKAPMSTVYEKPISIVQVNYATLLKECTAEQDGTAGTIMNRHSSSNKTLT